MLVKLQKGDDQDDSEKCKQTDKAEIYGKEGIQ